MVKGIQKSLYQDSDKRSSLSIGIIMGSYEKKAIKLNTEGWMSLGFFFFNKKKEGKKKIPVREENV